MGSVAIIVLALSFCGVSCFGEALEPVLVEALVRESPLEALTGAVPHRLPGLDEVMPDLWVVAPLVKGPAGELGAVLRDHGLRIAPLVDDALQDVRHPMALNVRVHLHRQALTGEEVDHIQRP